MKTLSIVSMVVTIAAMVAWGVTMSKGFAACMALSACVGFCAEWHNTKEWRKEEEEQ